MKSKVTTQPADRTTNPVIIRAYTKPTYTEAALKNHVVGEVELKVDFMASGKVHVISILHGLGFGLDEQAIRAAEKTQFIPAIVNGVKVDTETTVHVTFDLA